jgi:hypothetical protein
MFHKLSEYLKHYRSLVTTHSIDTKIILNIINTETATEITEKSLTIKNGIISIAVHPIVKGLIYQKKEQILKKIKEAGIRHIKDIH